MAYLRKEAQSQCVGLTIFQNSILPLMGRSVLLHGTERFIVSFRLGTCVYVLNIRLSRLSVILPPYCTSDTMYWNVGQLQKVRRRFKFNHVQCVRVAARTEQIGYSHLLGGKLAVKTMCSHEQPFQLKSAKLVAGTSRWGVQEPISCAWQA